MRTAGLILCISVFILTACRVQPPARCRVGAFLADVPDSIDIERFRRELSDKLSIILVFVDWDNIVQLRVIEDVYNSGCSLMITWEPWYAADKMPVDYDALLTGSYDEYIDDFARSIKNIPGEVFLRFAHEANGDWYPWSGPVIGYDKYIRICRYVKDRFVLSGVTNVKWVFAVNNESAFGHDAVWKCYPGDQYVDIIGFDGYNWGEAGSWSKWRPFKDIFGPVYDAAAVKYDKPLMITEVSSSSKGGDRSGWIKDALVELKNMKRIAAVVFFNVDKETDWKFSAAATDGGALRGILADRLFYR